MILNFVQLNFCIFMENFIKSVYKIIEYKPYMDFIYINKKIRWDNDALRPYHFLSHNINLMI